MITEAQHEVLNKKALKISILLTEKNVSFMDDYFEDIFFKDEDKRQEIFRAKSARFYADDADVANATLDSIIENLERI